MYETRHFAIFSTTELPLINFSEVLETDETTVRKNIAGNKVFVKWDSITPPPSVEALTTIEGYYTYTEISEILSGEEWTTPMGKPVLIRARDEDGRFISDDPSTPDVNESWVVSTENM
jgi:hypothetical protein